MLLPAFLLVGCAKSLTAEEATAKMQQIKEKRAAEPLDEWKFEIDSVTKTDGVVAHETHVVYEYSLSKNFYHMAASGVESWAFAKDDKFYALMAEGSNKEGYEFTGEQKTDFESYISSQVASGSLKFAVYANCDLPTLLEQYVPVANPDLKYSTKGDGQLTVEYKYTGEIEGAQGSLEFKAVWNDYKPAEISMSGTGEQAGIKMESSVAIKFAYSITPAYPDLTQFTLHHM